MAVTEEELVIAWEYVVTDPLGVRGVAPDDQDMRALCGVRLIYEGRVPRNQYRFGFLTGFQHIDLSEESLRGISIQGGTADVGDT